MASSDARPVARKNTALRVYFPIYDKTGALVTGGTGMDSEVSKDGNTAADCTNEATEIASSWGIYYLDLTSTELNTDATIVKITVTNTDARPTVLIIYPQEDGDYRVDIVMIGGTAVTAASGRMEVNTTHFAGSALTASSGRPEVNVSHFGGSAGSFASGRPSVNVNSIATDAVDAAAIKADAVTEIQSGLATASALATVAGYIDTEVAAIKAKTDNLPASPAAVGDIPSAASIASAVGALTIEGGYDLIESMRLQNSALFGKVSISAGTFSFRDIADSKDRIVAGTTADGERTSVTLDAS